LQREEHKPEPFTPFVRKFSGHLDGYGKVCNCCQPQQAAVVTPAPAPVKRVRTWADAEIADAERRGFPVYVASKMWQQTKSEKAG